ncbi:MAG: hypothetical protein OK438_01120 [Thaumarchaeota archaeon]|nr:hypothetical protein [Nitrososphaerota archaeon]
MKSLVLAFDDAEFERLKEAKGALTWRKWILSFAKGSMEAEAT